MAEVQSTHTHIKKKIKTKPNTIDKPTEYLFLPTIQTHVANINIMYRYLPVHLYSNLFFIHWTYQI